MNTGQLKEKFKLSIYTYTVTKNDITLICNTGYGTHLKIPRECWETIESYIEMYTPEDICEAANKEDRDYYMSVFKKLIDRRILVQDEEWLDTIDLAITNRCNLRCAHCAAAADSVLDEEFLSTEEWKNIIDKVLAVKPSSVVITGGEPMVRNDFFELLRYIREHYVGKIELMTNGLMISHDNVSNIVNNIDRISISLDGYDEETCTLIRGRGVFQKVIDVVNLLIKEGFDNNYISLSMVETAITYGKTDKFQELCDSLGIKSMIRLFSAVGRGEDNRDWLTPQMADTEFMETPADFRQALEKEYNSAERQILTPCRNCRAGKGKISINARGDVFPCQLLESKECCLGNALDCIDLYSLVAEDNKGIEHKFETKCSECEVNIFCQYCEADRVNDKDNCDEICENRKIFLSNMIWGDGSNVHNLGNERM